MSLVLKAEPEGDGAQPERNSGQGPFDDKIFIREHQELPHGSDIRNPKTDPEPSEPKIAKPPCVTPFLEALFY